MKIAAVILAAGRSSRFEDGHKLLAEIDGVPIVRRVALALAQSRVDDIILVTGANADDVLAAAAPGRWRSVVNPNATEGLSSSLSSAFRASTRRQMEPWLRSPTCPASALSWSTRCSPRSLKVQEIPSSFRSQATAGADIR